MEVHCEPEHIAAWFDKDKIDKILYNLLSNAIKFSYTDGRGKIIVTLVAEELENEYQHKQLTIKVGNQGKGIGKEELPQIFTRFYEKNFRQSGKGNGIGLALTKSLVELHNGTIIVDSELNGWTEFTIRIPISRKAFREEQIEDEKQEKIISMQTLSEDKDPSTINSGNTTGKHSLLLIEDDMELRTSLQHLLSEKYYTVTASNGQEGLNIAAQINLDMIISDVMMPKMDGFELCKRIKKDINISHIPVILLTAKIDGSDHLEGLKCGADSYITKPFSYTLLEAQIETILSNRKRTIEKFRSSPLTQEINLSISSFEEKFLENTIEIVKKNIEDPEFDVKQLIEEMQVSNSMLYRKLKALTNLSPNEFIRNIRLKTATELLRQKKGNISEIAYQVGFKDARYFSVCFKKEFNMTPSEYMEKSQSI